MSSTDVADVDGAVMSDAELIVQVRGGDRQAFGELYTRHVDAATRLANHLVYGTRQSADDVVSETFLGVMQAYQSGHGPDDSFRPYLYAAIRHRVSAEALRERRVLTVEGLEHLEDHRASSDTAVGRFEAEVVTGAFTSLPDRWQAVLWYHEVEAMKPAKIAPLLGLTPNGVSLLLRRAKEKLREAYLEGHLLAVDQEERPECQFTAAHLGAYVRGKASQRDRRRVDTHIRWCEDCRAMAAEVRHVNRGLIAVILPLVVGAGAGPWLQSQWNTPGTSSTVAAFAFKRRNAAATTLGAASIALVLATGAVAAGTYIGESEAATSAESASPKPPGTRQGPDETSAPTPIVKPNDQEGATGSEQEELAPVAPRPWPPTAPQEQGPVSGAEPIVETLQLTLMTGAQRIVDAEHPTLDLAGMSVQRASIRWVTSTEEFSTMVVLTTPAGDFALEADTTEITADDGQTRYISTADATDLVATAGAGDYTLWEELADVDWMLEVVDDAADAGGFVLELPVEIAAGAVRSFVIGDAPIEGTVYALADVPGAVRAELTGTTLTLSSDIGGVLIRLVIVVER